MHKTPKEGILDSRLRGNDEREHGNDITEVGNDKQNRKYRIAY